VESRMTLAEGESVNFIEWVDVYEIAVIDPSDPKADDVVVVPGSLLKKGGVIRNDNLPADLEVLQYMKNSHIVGADEAPDAEGPVFTSLIGEQYKIQPAREEAGAGSERADIPSVRVRFLKKGTGEPLGTHLLSLYFDWNVTKRTPNFRFPPQRLQVGDKSYTVELRPKRVYKPYSLHLIKFHHDKYIGSDTPRNYSSDVRLIDPTRNENRELKISMNEPLRYGGETFYQASFFENNKG